MIDGELITNVNVRLKYFNQVRNLQHRKKSGYAPVKIIPSHCGSVCKNVSFDWFAIKSHPAMLDFCSYLVVDLKMTGDVTIEKMFVYTKTPCQKYVSKKNRRFVKLYDVSEQKLSKFAYAMNGEELNDQATIRMMAK